MSARDILSALRDKDYHTANEAFSRVMLTKLALGLAQERKSVCKDMFAEAKDELPAEEIQRVYDETGNATETELLCGVKQLRVNGSGQVVAYVSEGMTYHQCPDCEKSFTDKQLVNGKLPAHTFNGKSCSGQLQEAINRPNTSGQGYDDDYLNNPYHGIIRKYGYQYSHSTPVTHGAEKIIHHTYKQGEHNVSVWGNNWSTSTSTASGRQVSGGHPNTARAGADLERHLLNKARRYDLTEAFDALPGVDEDTKAAVEKVNKILDEAQDIYNDEEAATRFKDQPNWKQNVAGFKHHLRITIKSKYILLDRVDANGTSASGCMMVDRTDGRIYGTKAYGVVNKIHSFGTAAEPKIKDMAMKASVLERAVIARNF